MKKFLLLAALICSLSASAQDFRFGLTGGLNVSGPTHLDSKVGFNLGARGEARLKKGFSLTGALLISDQGWKQTLEWDGRNGYSLDAEAFYLKMPLRVMYRHALTRRAALFFDFGPYFAFGFAGRTKVTQVNKRGIVVAKYNRDTFGDEGADSFDWGLGFNFGAEFARHYRISLGSDWGLKKFDGANKNNVFDISFTYMF